MRSWVIKLLSTYIVVQERFHEARDQHLAEAPRRRLRFKQGAPQISRLELDSNSGEDLHKKYGGDVEDQEEELDDGWPESVEEQGLLLLVWRHHITKQYKTIY